MTRTTASATKRRRVPTRRWPRGVSAESGAGVRAPEGKVIPLLYFDVIESQKSGEGTVNFLICGLE